MTGYMFISFRTAENMRVALGAMKVDDPTNPVFKVKKIVKADYNA